MTALRHAVSPVSAPVKLTRAREDAILLWAGIDVRTQAKRMKIQFGTTHAEHLRYLRDRLRLDDPVLGDIIAGYERRGERIPWSHERSRA